jgi:hypothetical protein
MSVIMCLCACTHVCLQAQILTNMASDCLRGNSHLLGSDQGMGYPFYASEKTAVKTMRVTGRRNIAYC